MPQQRVGALVHSFIGLVLSGVVAAPGWAESPDVETAEALVRQQWYEGLPAEEARSVGPAGADRLMEMLADPEERQHHANILIVLSQCGEPGANAAIDDFADAPREGEVDRATFRALQVVPFAFGHLAATDPSMLDKLEADLDAAPPSWSFRNLDGERLAILRRRAAATSLAMTGLPEAGAILEQKASSSEDPEFVAHIQEVLELHFEQVPGVPQ